MTGDRRKFRREGEEKRREALIAATVALVSEAGAGFATVRAIADRAGVTPGLIRHYFATREDLLRAAYRQVMESMTAESLVAAEQAGETPEARLAAFVGASFRPPVLDPQRLGVWAGFLDMVRRDPAVRDIHETTYLSYRNQLQGLIAQLDRPADEGQLRREAIACNAVIDGLWMEGSALPDAFAEGELAQIGLSAIGAVLGVKLEGAA